MRNIHLTFLTIFIIINSCIVSPDTIEIIDHFVLYPLDKSQAITIITKNNIRYVINGNYDHIPKTNYIKLDISQIDPIGDEIGVCWNNGKYLWELVNHKATILENRLDTLKFKFNNHWEVDKRGIPNAAKYHQNMCGSTGTSFFIPAKGDDLLLEEK